MVTEMPADEAKAAVAVIAVTESGVRLALRLQQLLPAAVVYAPSRHRFAMAFGAHGFKRLKEVFPKVWSRHRAVVCIMAAGIVVRLSAPLIRSKREDPAVVVLDERGHFVISLLSGHLGGANRLAVQVADLVGGQAVITTASDVQSKPALDLLAEDLKLKVENPDMLARLERALLEDEPFSVYDPHELVRSALSGLPEVRWLERPPQEAERSGDPTGPVPLGIWASEEAAPSAESWLILRPASLVVGVGCNRNTAADEILGLITDVLKIGRLSSLAIRNLASIELKTDEPGLLEAAQALHVPIQFCTRKQLAAVAVPNPSETVMKHVGAPSVCEASALVSAGSSHLLIPKHKSRNATVAVAAVDSISSV